jgi:hypothetical protein
MQVSVSCPSSIFYELLRTVGVGGALFKINTTGRFLFKCFLAFLFRLSTFSLFFSVARLSSEAVFVTKFEPIKVTLQTDPVFDV